MTMDGANETELAPADVGRALAQLAVPLDQFHVDSASATSTRERVPKVPPYVPAHGLLAGKTVLVTAAAGTGIGSSVAQRCLEEGASVVISDKHEQRLADTAATLGVTGIPCDVSDEAAVQTLFATAADELGAIDLLVNNAGLGAQPICTR
jgi:FlaA1/EpsC-like NDP-sugar epimerase